MGVFDKIFRRRGGSESDQLPEEGPAEQVVDDVPQDARPGATSSPEWAGPGTEPGPDTRTRLRRAASGS